MVTWLYHANISILLDFLTKPPLKKLQGFAYTLFRQYLPVPGFEDIHSEGLRGIYQLELITSIP